MLQANQGRTVLGVEAVAPQGPHGVWAVERAASHLAFLRGHAAPTLAFGGDGEWKCRFCDFRGSCAAELCHRRDEEQRQRGAAAAAAVMQGAGKGSGRGGPVA